MIGKNKVCDNCVMNIKVNLSKSDGTIKRGIFLQKIIEEIKKHKPEGFGNYNIMFYILDRTSYLYKGAISVLGMIFLAIMIGSSLHSIHFNYGTFIWVLFAFVSIIHILEQYFKRPKKATLLTHMYTHIVAPLFVLYVIASSFLWFDFLYDAYHRDGLTRIILFIFFFLSPIIIFAIGRWISLLVTVTTRIISVKSGDIQK